MIKKPSPLSALIKYRPSTNHPGNMVPASDGSYVHIKDVRTVLAALRTAPGKPVIHNLKLWPEPFDAMERGEKVHEFRKNDRGFKIGDILHFKRWDPATESPTGAEMSRRVTYIGIGFGIPDGYCCMSVAP